MQEGGAGRFDTATRMGGEGRGATTAVGGVLKYAKGPATTEPVRARPPWARFFDPSARSGRALGARARVARARVSRFVSGLALRRVASLFTFSTSCPAFRHLSMLAPLATSAVAMNPLMTGSGTLRLTFFAVK